MKVLFRIGHNRYYVIETNEADQSAKVVDTFNDDRCLPEQKLIEENAKDSQPSERLTGCVAAR